ncbi:hypothetical protein [Sporosarcina sp. A2]|uniref:hypothetical protein n=1 Tax=Sporosarcina sp. A2 TaxID=3393449 RepID=UPI003D7C0DEE
MKNAQERQGKPERIQHTHTANKPIERLSDKDLAELMGTNRDTYIRRRGAVRKR